MLFGDAKKSWTKFWRNAFIIPKTISNYAAFHNVKTVMNIHFIIEAKATSSDNLSVPLRALISRKN